MSVQLALYKARKNGSTYLSAGGQAASTATASSSFADLLQQQRA